MKCEVLRHCYDDSMPPIALTRPAHVTINELTIMPTAQANTAYYHKE